MALCSGTAGLGGERERKYVDLKTMWARRASEVSARHAEADARSSSAARRVRRDVWPEQWPSRSWKCGLQDGSGNQAFDSHNFSQGVHAAPASPVPTPLAPPVSMADGRSAASCDVPPALVLGRAADSSLPQLVTPLPNGRPAGIAAFAAQLVREHRLEDTFFITDIGATSMLYAHMAAALPRVKAHYAVKCFPDTSVLATLAALGAGFDCASDHEATTVLGLGVTPDRIVFANPCKRLSDLRTIRDHGIAFTTFDSVPELEKLAEKCPGVGAVLRIRADDPTARLPFGTKYGALRHEVPPLLQAAKALGVWVAGVSFHVGSGAGSSDCFRVALSEAKRVFDAQLDGEREMVLLDIGGGFSGGFDDAGHAQICTTDGSDVAAVINSALDEFFPTDRFPRLQVISEPGRYFAEASASVLTRVIGKRLRERPWDSTAADADASAETPEWHYWISDGIYGNFNAVLYDAWLPHAVPIRVEPPHGDRPRTHARPSPADHAEPPLATFFGPSCDSLDIVFHRVPRVPELEVGDWLLFPCCGAYTAAGATDFNGIPATAHAGVRTWYVSSESFTRTAADTELPVIYSTIPPMEVRKLF